MVIVFIFLTSVGVWSARSKVEDCERALQEHDSHDVVGFRPWSKV